MSDWIAAPGNGCAWVTGASTGIGRAVALRLAADGWRVAASARGVAELEALANEASGPTGEIIAFPLDVRDRAACLQTVADIEQALGPIALAILNAGVYLPVDGAEFDAEPYETSIQVNYLGVINCLGGLVPRMVSRQMGHLAIVSSVTGYGGLPTSAAYGATKAALINLAESLKFDLDRHHVRVSVICPGFVDTPATQENEFPMPFLVPVDRAAERIVEGLKKSGFEITFPRRFTYSLKVLNMLPRRLYFWLVKRFTGWR